MTMLLVAGKALITLFGVTSGRSVCTTACADSCESWNTSVTTWSPRARRASRAPA